VGYRLRVEADEVDVHRFRALVREGDAALRAGRAAEAQRCLRDGLALWRDDEPVTGVASHTGLAAEAVRLQQERLAALEARIAADLAAGQHADLVGELEQLVHQHPFRERLWAHLMVALYRSGRQADALAAYQRVRQVLLDELGLEPGGELRRLEAAVLRHEVPAVTAPVDSTEGTATIRPSPVRYALTSDGINVAFQTAGSGPLDILSIPGYIHHLDIWWNAPTDGLVRTLTSMGRLIVFDKRGIGLSDRPEVVDVDAWTRDALAVLDAAGAGRVVLFGVSAGALTALQLAARHPDRVAAIVLFGGYARHLVAPDYAAGHDPAIVESYGRNLEAKWGTGVALSSAAPSLAGDADVRAYWARYQRLSASPASAMRFFHAVNEADVRSVLPDVHVPTLVVHAERDLLVPVAMGRYIAEHVEGAELVVLDSDIHLVCVSDVLDQVGEHVRDFLDRYLVETVAPEVATAG
jgi:pimeloyl-ACP methyl ester carboxylesterase